MEIIYKVTNLTFSRWTTSLHGRTYISCKTRTYYGMGQRVDARGEGHPRQLKQDAEYEDLIHKQLVEAGVFAQTPSHPDNLYSLLTKDMATEKIEASLLGAATLGRQQLEEFVMQRLTDPPSLAFSSKLSKVKAPTFANLYDVQADKSGKEVVSVNRTVLQRIITAYQAERPVDLPSITSHELIGVPISIFEANGSL